jgi:hypothetical protein
MSLRAAIASLIVLFVLLVPGWASAAGSNAPAEPTLSGASLAALIAGSLLPALVLMFRDKQRLPQIDERFDERR